jgi:hypothetical protein
VTITDYIFQNPDIVIPVIIFLPLAIFGSLPVMKNLFATMNKKLSGRIAVNIWTIAIFYLSVVMLLGQTYNPFIYFRF